MESGGERMEVKVVVGVVRIVGFHEAQRSTTQLQLHVELHVEI
jgi:hypothetical protein